MLVLGTFICFPLAFGLACDDFEAYGDVLKICGDEKNIEENTLVLMDMIGESHEDCSLPLIFYLLSGGDTDSVRQSNYIVFLMVISVFWRVVDMFVNMGTIYRRMLTEEFKFCHSWLFTFLMLIAFQVIFSVFELLGLFLNFHGSEYFLILWPVCNFFRVVDCLVILLCHSRGGCLECCYREQYDFFFFIFDSVGTTAGFMMSNDFLWEKIGTVLYELMDMIFAVVYTLNNFGIRFSFNWLNVFSILRIVSLSLNTIFTFKNYFWIKNYICSTLTSIVFGVIVFVVFFLIQLRSMLIFSGVKYIFLVMPLLVIIPVFALFTFCCTQCGLATWDSVFYQKRDAK